MTQLFDGLTQHNVVTFGDWARVEQLAKDLSLANGAPVQIWERDGWYVVCEDPEPEPNPEGEGWNSIAVVFEESR